MFLHASKAVKHICDSKSHPKQLLSQFLMKCFQKYFGKKLYIISISEALYCQEYQCCHRSTSVFYGVFYSFIWISMQKFLFKKSDITLCIHLHFECTLRTFCMLGRDSSISSMRIPPNPWRSWFFRRLINPFLSRILYFGRKAYFFVPSSSMILTLGLLTRA